MVDIILFCLLQDDDPFLTYVFWGELTLQPFAAHSGCTAGVACPDGQWFGSLARELVSRLFSTTANVSVCIYTLYNYMVPRHIMYSSA